MGKPRTWRGIFLSSLAQDFIEGWKAKRKAISKPSFLSSLAQDFIEGGVPW